MPEEYSASEGPKSGSNANVHELTNGWTKNIVYLFNGILFSRKKEWSTDACYMCEPWRHHAKWKKQVTKDHVL